MVGNTSRKMTLEKARHILHLIRGRHFDASTAEGRAKERDRRAILTALAAVAAKSISVLTALISVPLTFRYLGPERYGVWMTITSIVGMLAFADLGLGNGLLNIIAKANGSNDKALARMAISSAVFMLAAIGSILGGLFCVVFPHADWRSILNIHTPEAIDEAKAAIVIFTICFLINLPLAVVGRIQLGYQRGFLNNLWSGGGNLLGLVGVLTAIKFQAGLPWLVFAMVGTPVIANMLNAAVLFGIQERSLFPSWRNLQLAAIRSLLRLGVSFFLLQIFYAIAFTSDNIVVAQLFDQDSVATYSVVARLFTVLPMLTEMFLTPLWPAYAEALEKKDIRWVKRTLCRTTVLASVATASCAMLLVFTGNSILGLWVGGGIRVSVLLLSVFGMWMILSVVGSTAAVFLNGTGSLKFQLACGGALAVVALALKVILGALLGLPGVVLGVTFAYVACVALPIGFYIPVLLRKMESQR